MARERRKQAALPTPHRLSPHPPLALRHPQPSTPPTRSLVSSHNRCRSTRMPLGRLRTRRTRCCGSPRPATFPPSSPRRAVDSSARQRAC
jgi:hypothetical protein